MTTKRFSVLVMSGRTGAEPGTLVLSSVSSRPETLSFEVYSARGRAPLLFKGETWREWRLPPDHQGALDGQPCPIGHEVVRLVEGHDGAHRDFVTVVADEIVAGAKALRRSKPRASAPKSIGDEVWVCACCGLRVMSRSDNPGWKGVRMSPDSPVYTYYCAKSVCVEALNAAIEQAKVNWGYEDTSGAPPERDAPPENVDAEPQRPMGILTNRR